MFRYVALACDYDGTLAKDGKVSETTVGALQRVRESGRRLLLVTGRQLDDLQLVFERLDLFDYVVAENGALLYFTQTTTGADALPGYTGNFEVRSGFVCCMIQNLDKNETPHTKRLG